MAGRKSKEARPWLISASVIAVLIALPLLIIFQEIFTAGSTWSTLFTTLQSDYIFNSLKLIFGVGTLALLLGVPTAWCVVNYKFRGSRFLEWALILPLTIPAYIMAITYSGIFDYSGPVRSFIKAQFGAEAAKSYDFDIMTLPWLIVLLALVLYPYVYVAAKAAFTMQASSHLETGQTLGKSKTSLFFKIAIPMARPAIIGGVFLVIMEVLNDYGAMQYFGVSTFTTEIFRSWSGRENGLSLAILLSAILLLIVLILMLLERWQRNKISYQTGAKVRPISKQKLKGWRGLLMLFLCGLPFLFGFLIPVAQLVSWSIRTAATTIDAEFWSMTGTSCLLALIAAVLVVAISLLIAYARRLSSGPLANLVSRMAVIGYAIPGAIIAIGVWIPLTFLDKSYGSLILTGSAFALIFAYVVRFMAVGFNNIESGFGKISSSFDDASSSLGKSPGFTLFKVHIPLLKPALLGAVLLVFVDVLKELPLTLIMRPFNMDTLATVTYELADKESVAEAANPALFIILAGIIPIFLLHKLLVRRT